MAHIFKRYKKNGDLRYVVRFRAPNGKWTERVAGGTREAAEILKNRIECELNEGVFGTGDNPLFKDYIEGFCRAKKELVKPSTYEDYCRVIRNHFIPYFGDMRLSKIKPATVKDFMFLMEEKGLSLETRGKLFRYLKSILQTAWHWGVIDRDPTFTIQRPRRAHRVMDYLTPEEIKILLSKTQGEMKALLSVACLAGLRQGEILGLKWRDIDFDREKISVVRNYSPVHGFGPPKTESSRRAVPLIPKLAETLRAHHNSQGQPNLNDLVFPNSIGNPKDRTNLTNREFKRALRRAGLRMIRFHDLRHSYASLCIAAGINPKALQQAMGHHSVETTLDVYAHMLPGSYTNIVEKMETILALNNL
ncbi:MAG: site-specific integrase [Actinobacteria bacterium]|nr:site-specific integrase [Actinomycetota bacterium]